MEEKKIEILKKSYFPEISLAFGVLSFIPAAGLFFGITAIILGIIGIIRVKKGVIANKRFSYAGIILGTVGMVFSVAMFSICFMAICTAGFLNINLNDLYLIIIRFITNLF